MMVTVTQEDREAAASVAVLAEMRELILSGRADHHAEPFARHRLATEAAIVAWLRSDDAHGPIGSLATAIEAGEHMSKTPQFLDI